MKKRYFYLTAIIAVLGFAVLGLVFQPVSQRAAAKATVNFGDREPSDNIKEKMNSAEEKLRGLEKSLDKIEADRVITAEDNDALDKNGLALGDTLYEAFQAASMSAQKAADSEGREGNVADLEYFESFEADHVKRTETIVERSEKIQRGIEDGTIILKDRQEPGVMMAKANYNAKNEKPESACETMPANGSKVLKPCIAPCIAQNWSACATCIIRNVPAGIQHYNQFRDCWNGCHGFWKWFCRARCLAVFVYWIY